MFVVHFCIYQCLYIALSFGADKHTTKSTLFAKETPSSGKIGRCESVGIEIRINTHGVMGAPCLSARSLLGGSCPGATLFERLIDQDGKQPSFEVRLDHLASTRGGSGVGVGRRGLRIWNCKEHLSSKLTWVWYEMQ